MPDSMNETAPVNSNRMKAVRVVICAICVVAIGLLAMDCIRNVMAQDAILSNLNAQLAEARSALDGATSTEPVDAASVSKTLATARDAGDKVAQLQNNYGGTLDEAGITSNAEELAKLFKAGDDASSGRVPWPPAAEVKHTWSFATTLQSTQDTIPCVWFCIDQSDEGKGRVLGYVLADYSVADGTFSNLEKHVTSYGSSKIPATDDSAYAQQQQQASSDAAATAEQTGTDEHTDIDPDAIAAAEQDGE